MITISTSETIDLVEIEKLRKWCEYMPECFINNLACEKFNDRLVEDRLILHNINKLYLLIEEVTGKKIDCKNSIFNIGKTTLEQRDKLDKIKSNIPRFNISKYAKLKLTEEEKLFCYSFVTRCSKQNSNEIADEIDSISNFFLKSYAKYLLIHAPESDYRISTNNIGKNVSEVSKKVEKAFKRIRSRETKSWAHARDKIYSS